MSDTCFFTALGQNEAKSSQFILISCDNDSQRTARCQAPNLSERSTGQGYVSVLSSSQFTYFVPKKRALICAMHPQILQDKLGAPNFPKVQGPMFLFWLEKAWFLVDNQALG